MTLVEDFLSRRLDPSVFSHQAHVEVAWSLLERFPFEQAFAEFEAGVRDLASRAGAPEKYHATMTRALMQIIQSDQDHGAFETWSDYFLSAPKVLNDARTLLLRHFSEARLFSERARLAWCEPDLVPLPATNTANNPEIRKEKLNPHGRIKA